MFSVMGIMARFHNRQHLQRLEKEKGIVIRFVIGRRTSCSANPSPDGEVERAIDADDKEYSDILRLNHVKDWASYEIQMFLSTAESTWDADFLCQVFFREISMSKLTMMFMSTLALPDILARNRSKPRGYIGCMKSGPVIANK